MVPGLVQAKKHNATQLVLEMQNIKFSSNGPSYGDYAAKALLPYKAFIEEIINAQRHIDVTEAQEYLKENAWGRCIERYSKYGIKDKTRSRKRVEEGGDSRRTRRPDSREKLLQRAGDDRR